MAYVNIGEENEQVEFKRKRLLKARIDTVASVTYNTGIIEHDRGQTFYSRS